MQSEEEGDDCAVEGLKGEEDFLQIDSWSDCDNGIDRFEEEDKTDGWFWKDNVEKWDDLVDDTVE